MITLTGTMRRLCDGISRRDFLHIGGLGGFGSDRERSVRLAR